MKQIDKSLLIERHMDDISKIYPDKLLLNKEELARVRNISQSTLNREKQRGTGVPYKKEGGRILYPVREVAKWLCTTTQTA